MVGVVSGSVNPNDSSVGALDRRSCHDEGYHEGGVCRRRHHAFRQLVDPMRTAFAHGCAGSSEQRCWRKTDAALSGPAMGGARRATMMPASVGGLPAWPSQAHADGHVRQDRDRRAARPRHGRGWQDARMEDKSLRAYQRRTKAADALIARRLSCRNQHAPRAPCAQGGFRR